ncbi:MAG TPA: hypothetical protein DDZ96_06350 [Porphyromonadaceae bacterium]|jgi:ABC-type antimicrobial peptide transport system permease subunit|nr:hypothetical protein [Porphyromonadaceae bacterium]HCM20059.1 hypothetical protein [Porphyromonadaceae bacterium]
MIGHYLKIAWRNILKYKTQSIISVLGLAIGFTAFSFTLSWIRYEMGYDSHIVGAENIYRVIRKDVNGNDLWKMNVPYQLAEYLRATFPEIESVTAIKRQKKSFIDKTSSIAISPNEWCIETDTSFFRVFYPGIPIRFPTAFEPDKKTVVITDKINKLYLSADSEIKKSATSAMNIVSVVPVVPKESNIFFDFVEIQSESPVDPRREMWLSDLHHIYVRMNPNTDIQSFEQKLTVPKEITNFGDQFYQLVPLRKLHYLYPEQPTFIKFSHVKIFAAVALLIILSGLFNYLMLFVSKIRIRGREMGLRKVNGSSGKQLIALLYTEFILILLCALFFGGILVELLTPQFLKLSLLDIPRDYLIKELFIYGFLLIAISLMGFLIPITIFLNKNLKDNIHKKNKQYGYFKNRFTFISLLLQLTVCALLISCSLIFFLQYRHFTHADLGFDRHNIALACHSGMDIDFQEQLKKDIPIDEIRNLAYIEDAIYTQTSLIPKFAGESSSFLNDSNIKTKPEEYYVTPDFFRFFHIKLKSGRIMHEGEKNVCLINQTAAKSLAYENPIGEMVGTYFKVIGITEDIYNGLPSEPPAPAIYYIHDNPDYGQYVLFKYSSGKYSEIKQSIEKLNEKSDVKIGLINLEEEYATYIQSERYLLILLSIMTGVAILIAVFGIYSMITLSCNQRRKEIAIRKVNGARAKEILAMFFKQYAFITVLSCIIAFPVGALIMQRWLEQYTRRIVLEWWLFAGVFLLVALIVFGSILFRVLKAAGENPAEVVKSE